MSELHAVVAAVVDLLATDDELGERLDQLALGEVGARDPYMVERPQDLLGEQLIEDLVARLKRRRAGGMERAA